MHCWVNMPYSMPSSNIWNIQFPLPTRYPLVKSQGAMLAVALASHANLEDELLFTTLESHLGPIGPLTVMRMEHDQIEGALERLPTVQNLAGARTLLLQVIKVAREHFAKEEQILYPLASRSLTIEALTGLGAQWAARRLIVLR